jgi:hypothetical protein
MFTKLQNLCLPLFPAKPRRSTHVQCLAVLKQQHPLGWSFLPRFASRFHLDLIVPGVGLWSIPENGLQFLLFLGGCVYVVRVIGSATSQKHNELWHAPSVIPTTCSRAHPAMCLRTEPFASLPPGQVPSGLLVCILHGPYDERFASYPIIIRGMIIDYCRNRSGDDTAKRKRATS